MTSSSGSLQVARAGSAIVGDHLVVVEDDRSLREMLATVLTDEGYHVTALSSAESLLAGPPDETAMLIVDVGLPGVTGVDACAHLRRRGVRLPILILTARSDPADRVRGLDAGADDYLTKPFALDELFARVRALLRRRSYELGVSSGPISFADVDIDPATRTVTRRGAAIDLTRIEFDLLHLLIRSSPAVVTRQHIHRAIWDSDETHMSNSLEVFVSQLRKKLERDDGARIVHTVRGVGYVARSR